MKITWELIRFPLDDERWMRKAAVGVVLTLLGIILFPLLLPIYGYGLRVMRQTVKGEAPSMPEWDDWGQLFADGLRYMVVQLVYTAPVTIPLCCAAAFWVVILLGMEGVGPNLRGAMTFLEGDSAFLAGWILSMGIITLATVVAMPLTFVAQVAQTRWVSEGSLSAAFAFGDVWRLTRKGIADYLLAFIIWYAVIFGISMVGSMLIYTIILICLYPFALGLMSLYSAVLNGALFGMAYHHTVSAPSELAEAAPA